jgi:hypothetical protein
MQSHSGSTHSPHRIRKIIMKEWKKSVKFHLRREGNSVKLHRVTRRNRVIAIQ